MLTSFLAYRETLNLISSFIDGSVIYGNSLEKSLSLRQMIGGKTYSMKKIYKIHKKIYKIHKKLFKCFFMFGILNDMF